MGTRQLLDDDEALPSGAADVGDGLDGVRRHCLMRLSLGLLLFKARCRRSNGGELLFKASLELCKARRLFCGAGLGLALRCDGNPQPLFRSVTCPCGTVEQGGIPESRDVPSRSR